MEAPLVHLFLHSGHALDAELRARMARVGIQHRQARVLDLIDRFEAGISQADLARLLGISPPSLSVMVARMEREGLVSRAQRAGDARAVEIALTPRGAGDIERARTVWRELEAIVRRRLGAGNIEATRTILKSVRDAFDAAAPDEYMEKS